MVMSQSWFSNLLASTAFTHIVDYAVKTLACLMPNNNLSMMNEISYAYVYIWHISSDLNVVVYNHYSGFVQPHHQVIFL